MGWLAWYDTLHWKVTSLAFSPHAQQLDYLNYVAAYAAPPIHIQPTLPSQTHQCKDKCRGVSVCCSFRMGYSCARSVLCATELKDTAYSSCVWIMSCYAWVVVLSSLQQMPATPPVVDPWIMILWWKSLQLLREGLGQCTGRNGNLKRRSLWRLATALQERSI